VVSSPASLHFWCAASQNLKLSELGIRLTDSNGKQTTLPHARAVLDGSWSASSQLLSAGHYIVQLLGAPEVPLQFVQVLPSGPSAPAAMVMQTFLSKCLGPLSRWEQLLFAAVDTGYNAVHLSPLCSLGASGSAYSIQDHRTYAASLGVQDPSQCETQLKALFDGLRSRGCSLLSDFVPNHVASSASWLLESPSMTFNLLSAPWLTAAALLDETIQRIAEEVAQPWHPSRGRLNLAFAAGGLSRWGGAPAMDSPQRVRAVVEFVLQAAKARCRPWEFYALPETAASALADSCPWEGGADTPETEATQRAAKHFALKLSKHLLNTKGALENRSASGSRFPVRVGGAACAAWREAGLPACPLTPHALRCIAQETVAILNVHLFKVWDADAAALPSGLHSAAEQLWLHKLQGEGALGQGQGLVPAYFKRMYNTGQAWRSTIMACNGFVWGGDVLEVPTYPRSAQAAVKAALQEAARADALQAAGLQAEATQHTGGDVWPLACPAPLDAASGTYLRRELVAWSDCVKLNFGFQVQWARPMWRRMREYAEGLADMFDGVRLDNCHGTPLFVSQALLRCMRQRRPALCVVAELFTGDAALDAMFVSRLGITALVREMMQCHSPAVVLTTVLTASVGGSKLALGAPSALLDAPNVVRCTSSLPVMLYDVTHDNEPVSRKYGEWGSAAVAAVASMSPGAVGTTWGVDQLLPEQLDVVEEHRLVPIVAGAASGMLRFRGLLNALHRSLAARGLEECHAQLLPGAPHLLHVQRTSRTAGQSVHLLVALDAPISSSATGTGGTTAAHIVVHGAATGAAAYARLAAADAPLTSNGENTIPLPAEAGMCELSQACEAWMGGADTWGSLFCESALHGVQCPGLALQQQHGGTQVNVDCKQFVPGTVALFCTGWPAPALLQPAHPLAALLGAAHPAAATGPIFQQLCADCEDMDSNDLRYCLYLCEAEERDGSGGQHGCYSVPQHGSLPWAGVAGIAPVLREFLQKDATGHAVAQHMRDGDWYLQYVVDRLARRPACSRLGATVQAAVQALGGCPREAMPALACNIVYSVWCALMGRCLAVLRDSPLLEELHRAAAGDGWCLAHAAHTKPFVWPAALQLMQHFFMLVGESSSAPLLDVALGGGEGLLAGPLPLGSMAAGVPHFSCSYMRCWGRDTFIACRGLTMLTGQWQAAAAHILAFASVIRHGLVPNLHNAGRKPRYNARDATWFWASAVVEYVQLAPEGAALLDVPLQHSDGQPWSVRQALHEVLAKAHEGHAFTEQGAGEGLDAHMTPEGFHVSYGPHSAPAFRDSGLVAGGNAANCGTWMDKMGSSAPWGNKGIPATPRCGAPVEITGLLYKVVVWAAAHAPPPPADNLPLQQWAQQLQTSANKLYFIPTDTQMDAEHLVRAELVSPLNRGYLRDVAATAPADSQLGAAADMPAQWPLEFTEYQLRPNQLIALAEAPGLWPHASLVSAVDACTQQLTQPASMGVRTLATFDWAFRGNYINSDSSSCETADGWNYHQGPEWLWLWGVHWRAHLRAHPAGPSQKLHELWSQATPHVQHLNSDAWGGLPELCNADNALCPDSCEVQAWSAATLLDALWDTLRLAPVK